jgi:anti-anti-sigma regulatory factor
LEEQIENVLKEIKIKDVVIDCSCVNFIDSMGIDALTKVNITYVLINLITPLTALNL